jgi:hypothetical protein
MSRKNVRYCNSKLPCNYQCAVYELSTEFSMFADVHQLSDDDEVHQLSDDDEVHQLSDDDEVHQLSDL